MATIPRPTRRSTISFMTFTVLLLAFMAYYFGYVKVREARLTERNFRVLAKISDNIHSKNADMVKNGHSAAAKLLTNTPYFDCVKQKLTIPVNKPLFLDFIQPNLSRYRQSEANTNLISSEEEVETGEQSDQGTVICPNNTSWALIGQMREALTAYNHDLTFNYLTDSIHARQSQVLFKLKPHREEWRINYGVFVTVTPARKTAPKTYQVGFETPVSSFLRTLLRFDDFEAFIIFNDTATIYSTMRGGVEIDGSDSLLNRPLGIQTGTVKALPISGVKYRVFAQPLKFGQGKPLVFCGLVKEENFRSDMLRIPTLLILILFLLFFLIVLSLPFIKLRVMSRNERLGIADTVFSGISVILGTAVALLILQDAYVYNIPDRDRRNSQLKGLADAISSSLSQEVDQIKRQIVHYESRGLINRDAERILAQDDLDYRPGVYPYFRSIFWVDSAGIQLRKYTVQDENTPKINLTHRDYFSRIVSGKGWADPELQRSFYLQSILSWTTGEHIIALSMNSEAEVHTGGRGDPPKAAAVVALTTRELYTITHPILPPGFGFCVIRENGEVVFHQDERRNLYENFLEEVNSNRLRSALYAHTSRRFNTTYHGLPHDMYVRPMEDLPLFLVTYQNEAYYKTTNEQILTFTFILSLLTFMLGLMRVLFLSLFTARTTKLQRTWFIFDWLRPNQFLRHRYRLLIASNLLVLLTLVIFTADAFKSSQYMRIICYIAFAYIYVFDYIYIVFNTPRLSSDGGEPRPGLRTYLRAIFQMLKRKNGYFYSSLLILIVFNLGAINVLGRNYFHVLFFQLILLLGGFVAGALALELIGKGSTPLAEGSRKRLDHRIGRMLYRTRMRRQSYIFFLISWLAIISVFPTITYYRMAYDQEMELRAKHTQLWLYRAIRERKQKIETRWQGVAEGEKNIARLASAGIFSQAFFSTKVQTAQHTQPAKDSVSEKRKARLHASMAFRNYQTFSNLVRPLYNDLAVQSNDLKANMADDKSWYWESPNRDQLNYRPNDRQNSLEISSVVPRYRMPAFLEKGEVNARFVIFWGIILVFFASLYSLILFGIRRIFSLNLINYAQQPNFDHALFNESGRHLFIVTPPHPRHSRYLDGLRDGDDKDRYYIDMVEHARQEDWSDIIEKAAALRGSGKVVVLDNFGYGIGDLALSAKQLHLVETLVTIPKQKIILASNLTPLEVQEAYLASISELEKAEEQIPYRRDLERWRTILSSFYQIFSPPSIEDEPTDPEAVMLEAGAHPRLREIVQRECDGIPFLYSLKNDLYRYYNVVPVHELEEEEVILKIQSLALLHYQSLWASCSPEQRYIIYDLAQDGLVNSRNVELTNTLIRKGIFKYEGTLQLMNDSFRNFVLTVIKAEDVLQMERNAKSGAWHTLRSPLMLILLALAGFLMFTQEESFGKLIGFLTSLTASVPILINLINTLSNMSLRSLRKA